MEHTCIQVPYGFPRRSFFDKRQPLESSSGADLQPLKLWNPQRERVSEALTSETLVFGGDEKIRNSVFCCSSISAEVLDVIDLLLFCCV